VVRALALSALVIAVAAVAVLGVAAVGAAPRAERDAPSEQARVSGGDSPVYPGLRTVGELSQPGGGPQATAVGPYPRLREPGALAFPGPEALEAARSYVAGRKGRISFAVADTRGDVAGLNSDRRYRAASLAKAMVLVAYLGEAERKRQTLSADQRKRLEAMIRISDNDAAISLHNEIGPGPMLALARRAGMRHFSDTGSWSESTLTAADQARFFAALDRLLPARHRSYARKLLEGVVEPQSWGVPKAARPSWRVMFKGGWRPSSGGSLVHQAARLERGPRTVAVAVLTDADPDQPYGEETIRQVTARLLAARGARPAEPAVPVAPAAPARLRPLRKLRGTSAPSPPPLIGIVR